MARVTESRVFVAERSTNAPLTFEVADPPDVTALFRKLPVFGLTVPVPIEFTAITIMSLLSPIVAVWNGFVVSPEVSK
jgi:hypothetical protein